MQLSPPQIHALFINAQRYCLGRSSYAVAEYCDIVKANWLDIPQNTRNILLKDLKSEVKSDRPLGHECDRREWIRLLKFMQDCQEAIVAATIASSEGAAKYSGTLKDLPTKTQNAQCSKYCVFRYCPDPINREVVNFGVAVFGVGENDNEIKFKFTADWERLKVFGRGEDIGFLQEFAERCLVDPVRVLAKPASVEWSEVMRLISLRWMNSIQVTAPSGSLFSTDECLDAISKALL